MKSSVLIVDDEGINVVELESILESDYTVYTAKNGREAISLVKEHLPDIILLDIIMPELNGYDVIKELKKTKTTQHIPVIFISGLDSRRDEEKGLELGAVDYITKPFSHMSVKLRVRNQIKLVEQSKEIREMENLAAQRAEAEASSKAKSAFLTKVSHEIRTPMNAIWGITGILMQDNSLSAEASEGLTRIHDACRMLHDIINEILDFTKIDADKLGIESDVNHIADLIKDSLQHISEPKTLELTYEHMPYGSILLVDDVDSNIYVAAGLLKPYGLQIDTAKSGQEAVEKIKKGNTYSIIFMDYMMPEMDGIETTKIIRAMGYKNPIAALTANAVMGQADMFLNNGFNELITKPIDIKRLELILYRYVRDMRFAQDDQCISQEAGQDAGQGTGQDAGQGTGQDAMPARLKELLDSSEIPCLDIKKGLKKFNSDALTYVNVLRSYIASVKSMISVIEEFSEEKIKEYTIAVHGIKGSSFDIYADKIGEKAKKLENAATQGDIEYIKTYNATLLALVQNLISDIEDMNLAINESKKSKECPDDKVLLRLLNACQECRLDEIEKAMAEIDYYTYTSDGGLVVFLQECVDILDFEQIENKLTDVLERGK